MRPLIQNDFEFLLCSTQFDRMLNGAAQGFIFGIGNFLLLIHQAQSRWSEAKWGVPLRRNIYRGSWCSIGCMVLHCLTSHFGVVTGEILERHCKRLTPNDNIFEQYVFLRIKH